MRVFSCGLHPSLMLASDHGPMLLRGVLFLLITLLIAAATAGAVQWLGGSPEPVVVPETIRLLPAPGGSARTPNAEIDPLTVVPAPERLNDRTTTTPAPTTEQPAAPAGDDDRGESDDDTDDLDDDPDLDDLDDDRDDDPDDDDPDDDDDDDDPDDD